MSSTRRSFLSTLTRGVPGVPLLMASPALVARIQAAGQALGAAGPAAAAADEAYWSTVASAFHLDGRHLVLNGGGQNPPARTVVDALTRYESHAAAQPRPNNGTLLGHIDEHRRRLAAHLRCTPDEVAITRNTTEGLNIVAHGLDLARGDEVVMSTADHEYAARAFRTRAERHGVVVREVPLPVPCVDDEVVARYRDAIGPRTRLVVASHVVDGFGFVLPIRQLSALAHERGIPLLADGALSFGHLIVDVGSLDCDYFATSLHKWLGAPLGTGVLFVRRNRLRHLWPLYGTDDPAMADARKFERIGTRAGAPIAAIGQALDFYEAVGPARKEARLRYLLQYVIDGLKDEPRVRFITDTDPGRRTSLARVTVEGWSGSALERAMLQRFGIWVWGRFEDAWGGIYVSPNLFNLPPHLDRFIAAARQLAAERPSE